MVAALKEPRTRDIFLCGLLLFSFFYELPLVEIFPYDRANPRLFDVALLVALFGTRWKRDGGNRILQAWEIVTILFVFAAVVSYALLLPPYYGKYSLFFGFKYVEALLAVWVLTGFNWTDESVKKLFKYLCYGLIFAGTWAVFQFLGILSSERYLPTDAPISLPKGAILATFGSTYFHSGVVGAMGAGVALALYLSKFIGKILFSLAFCLGLFLALFSGSRAALALAVIVIGVIAIRRIKYLVPIAILGTLLVVTPATRNFLLENSLTFQRLGSETTMNKNKALDRLRVNYLHEFSKMVNVHGLKMLAVGGGFYSVPMPDKRGHMHYRVAYGFHNIHFFVLEQAGIFAFIAALYFWWTVLRAGFRRRRELLSRAALGIGAGIFVLGWTGQIFYYGFGTENMVAFQVALLALLLGRDLTPSSEKVLASDSLGSAPPLEKAGDCTLSKT